MKKILLASSALVASASFAAADVSVGGNGYMGVTYDDSAVDEMMFKSRIRITFSASGETDGGLSFGGSIRADNAAGGASGTAGSVYVSGGMWKLSMGDVDGAMEQAVGDLAGVGYEGIGDLNETAYLSNVNPETALLQIDAGAATIYASAGQFGVGTIDLSDYGYGSLDYENNYAVGVSFDAGTVSVGAGYETADIDGVGIDGFGVSASTDLGSATVKALYTSHDFDGDDLDQAGISVEAPVGAMSVSAYYKQISLTGMADADVYGVGVAYDLGGGAAFKAGIVDADGDTLADAGLTFSF